VNVQVECDNCGAHLEFSAGKQALECPYCGTVSTVKHKEHYKPPEEKDFLAAPAHTGWAVDVISTKCDGCGATISSKSRSGECAFCGSPYIKTIPPNPNIIRPEHLIPFRIDNRYATNAFRTWLGQGFFRPSDLAQVARMNKLKGVYVPFWTYDCGTNSRWTAQSGYYYYETESYTTYEQGQRITKTRQVRKTRWVPSSGSRSDSYNDVLIVASRGLDYHLVLKIYPFHLGYLIPYKPEYLSGWQAEDYNIDVRHGWGIAKDQVQQDEYRKCGSEVPGDTHRFLRVNTSYSNITYKHILLPVWIASYHYKNKLYHFLINGQTGEVQGYKPISWLKVGAVAAAICGIVGGIIYYLCCL